MPGYRSNPGGLFNSGVQPDTRPQVNVGELLQAVGSGTGSIIHAVMARRMAEQQANTQQEELGMKRQQIKREGEQQVWERGFKEKELKEKSEANRRQDLINGLVTTPGAPASDATEQVPITPLAAPQSPISRAMAQSGGMPGPQLTPSAATGTGYPDSQGTVAPTAPAMSATVHDPKVAQPERTDYDPQRALSVINANTRATAANAVANTRATSAEQIARDRATSAEAIARGRETGRMAGINRAGELAGERQRKALEAKDKGPITKAMTAAQKDKIAVDDAIGFLAEHRGAKYEDALDIFKNTPEGQSLQESGLTESHLRRAFGKIKVDPTTGQILGLIQSGGAVESSKGAGDAAQVAGKMVQDARAAAAPPRFRAKEPDVPVGSSVKPDTAKPKLGERSMTKRMVTVPKSDTMATAQRESVASWKRDNPKKAGESDDAYYARYTTANPVKP